MRKEVTLTQPAQLRYQATKVRNKAKYLASSLSRGILKRLKKQLKGPVFNSEVASSGEVPVCNQLNTPAPTTLLFQ